MARWKELPDTLDQRERQLVVQLRRLKDRSGLTLAALAAKTTYSSSSWERWLNGKKPVPRGAVEELVRVCGGTDPTRLLVLHEVADGATREAAGAPKEPEEPPGMPEPPGPLPAHRPRHRLVVGAVAALLVAFAAGLLTGLSWHRGDDSGRERTVLTGGDYRRGQTYECHDGRKDGGLYAGYSLSNEVLLDLNSTGWDVVEAQCLLRRHGFEPGSTDGLYGERTKDAARAFQRARGLALDGIVGPDTWRELRK
ncbi:peptidoglycan-binding protein [Streptomyces albicerus]|uniref:peptidoglycan-binding protein n=1 Tax=Streptomyces albicerus TaxID=2569859 RepID=UPI00124AEE2A|nr:peptidoglycan-binding protein [Streptomyces albicerus]